MDLSSTNQLLPIIARGVKNYDFNETMEAKRNALKLRKAELELADYPEEKSWLRENRQLEREKTAIQKQRFDWEKEDRMDKISRRGFTDAKETLSFLLDEAPMINWQNYGKSRQWMLEKGLQQDILPPPEYFQQNGGKDPEKFFNEWKKTYLKGSRQALEEWKAEERSRAAEEREKAYQERLSDRLKHSEELQGQRQEHSEMLQEERFRHSEELQKERQALQEKQKETNVQREGWKQGKFNTVEKLLKDNYAQMMSVDPGQVVSRMTQEQYAAYKRILIDAERYLETMEPAEALDRAIQDFWARKERAKPKAGTPKERPPLSSFER